MLTFAEPTLAEGSTMRESKGGNIYIKGVTVRFDFDVLEPGKFKRFVKNKAMGTPCKGCIYIAS